MAKDELVGDVSEKKERKQECVDPQAKRKRQMKKKKRNKIRTK